MGISISFSLKDLVGVLDHQEQAALDAGGLDGEDVWYEYLTQADDRVRPSHAALHGTLWRADDPDAPTPPLDYGCRCYIRYCSNPSSKVASEILPEAKGELSSRTEAFTSYLDTEVGGWRNIASEAKQMRQRDRLQFVIDSLVDKDLAGASLARDIAFMVLSAL